MRHVQESSSVNKGVPMPKPRILVADDEEGVRESLRLILSSEYEVTCANDGKEALGKLGQGSFAMALLDIKMPKLDGLEVLKQLKRHGKPLPILMLTAYQSIELAKEAVKLGAVDYVPKPFDRDHLLKVVRSIFANRVLA